MTMTMTMTACQPQPSLSPVTAVMVPIHLAPQSAHHSGCLSFPPLHHLFVLHGGSLQPSILIIKKLSSSYFSAAVVKVVEQLGPIGQPELQ